MKRPYVKRKVSELNPGDIVHVLGEWYLVRYLNYHGTRTSIQLQEESKPLSPFLDSTCMSLTVDNDLPVVVSVAARVMSGYLKPGELCCWSCKKWMSNNELENADGFCPHCDAEIERNAPPYTDTSDKEAR